MARMISMAVKARFAQRIKLGEVPPLSIPPSPKAIVMCSNHIWRGAAATDSLHEVLRKYYEKHAMIPMDAELIKDMRLFEIAAGRQFTHGPSVKVWWWEKFKEFLAKHYNLYTNIASLLFLPIVIGGSYVHKIWFPKKSGAEVVIEKMLEVLDTIVKSEDTDAQVAEKKGVNLLQMLFECLEK